MLIKILLCLSLISPTECGLATPITAYDSYINTQLAKSDGRSTVRFKKEIPLIYHDHIREVADAAGWSVSIERCQGFYEYEECYLFTFNPK